MTTALFLGRFQPFHLGHLDAIKQIKEDDIIIAIGSAQYENTKDNPFSYKERKDMIDKVLKTEKINNYKIVPIKDIHNFPLWVDHVDKHVKYDTIYTKSEITKELFKKKNKQVKELKQNVNISGEELRNLIRNNKDWKKHIHSSLEEFFEIIEKSIKEIKLTS